MAVKERIAKSGDTIVVTAGVPLGQAVETNLIKAHVINETAAIGLWIAPEPEMPEQEYKNTKFPKAA